MVRRKKMLIITNTANNSLGDSGSMSIDSHSHFVLTWLWNLSPSLSISISFWSALRSFVLALARVGNSTHVLDVTTGHLAAKFIATKTLQYRYWLCLPGHVRQRERESGRKNEKTVSYSYIMRQAGNKLYRERQKSTGDWERESGPKRSTQSTVPGSTPHQSLHPTPPQKCPLHWMAAWAIPHR